VRKLRHMAVDPFCLAVAALLLQGTALATAGTGPDDALVPSASWVQLNAREDRWYAFQYTGDGSQIQSRLWAAPASSAAFSVWTPEEAQRWRLGLEVQPVGRGSTDPSAADVLIWSGSFTIPGTYYVVVEHTGNQPDAIYYLLQISGPGVSLVTASPTATPRPAPAPAASRPTVVTAPIGKLSTNT
jgi:hypothetical protein